MCAILRTIVATAVVVSAICSPVAQAADCTLANLQGKWKAYASGTDSGVTYWRSCLITVAANGNISNPSCVDSIGTNITLTNGKFTLQSAANCAYAATFKFNGQNNKVLNMTLARDKNTAYGVGTFPGGSFIFSTVKI